MLRSLILGGPLLTTEAEIEILAEALAQPSQLSVLIIRPMHHLGDDNCNYLVQALQRNPALKLEVLILRAVNIGDQTVTTLGQVLATNRTLKEIDLQGNQIQSLMPIVNALKTNKSSRLEKLNLRRNPLRADEGKAILEMLEVNTPSTSSKNGRSCLEQDTGSAPLESALTI